MRKNTNPPELEHENYMLRMERDLLKKIGRDREEAGLSQVRQSHIYLTIQECRKEFGYPVELCCGLLQISRAAYYRWLSGKKCRRELENEKIAEIAEQIHTENPDKGYRRIKDDLAHDHKLNVNEKRVLRICRSLDIKSTIKYKSNGCTRQAANPQHIAKNWLNRQFHSDHPDEKWLTDVTEFKYYIGPEVHKIYLSAICLCSRQWQPHAPGQRDRLAQQVQQAPQPTPHQSTCIPPPVCQAHDKK